MDTCSLSWILPRLAATVYAARLGEDQVRHSQITQSLFSILLPASPLMAMDGEYRAGECGDCAAPFLVAASPQGTTCRGTQELRLGQQETVMPTAHFVVYWDEYLEGLGDST